jgi:peptidoglycan/LPS O-acetylase OafA/YrhL
LEKSGTRKYEGLQALRFLAAFFVLIIHSTFYASERLDKNFVVWNRGATGVDIFFVLSGFVMIYSSVRLMKSRDGWRVFSERRIARIVPMYWLATTLKLITMLLTAGFVLHAHFSWITVVCSYLFLPTRNIDGVLAPLLGVGWTLIFEMFFYFLFALALFLRVDVYKLVGIVLSLLAIGAYFRQPDWPPVSFYLNTISLEFFLGMIIGHLCLKNWHLPRWIALVFIPLGFFLLLYPWPDVNAPRILLTGVPAALIVWATAALEDSLGWIPRWVIYLGDASYVIYLFHPMIAPAAPVILSHMHIYNSWLSVALSILLVLGVTSLIHQFIEVPVTNFLRNYLRVRHQKVINPATC